MKKFLLFLLLLPSGLFAQGLATDEKEYTYPPARDCGLVTRWASNTIKPECLTEALNVYFDEDSSIYRRRGVAKYNNTPCTDSKAIKGLWNYDATDGQKYMIIFSSQSFFYTKNQGDCVSISGANNLNATAEYECVQSLGKLWCLNGIDPSFSIDSTLTYSTYTPSEAITTSVESMPLGTKISTFRNRLVVAGVSGKMSRILLSGDGNGTDWVLKIPGQSTSPATIDISGTNDGKPVTSLLGQFQNAFYIGRNDDLYSLSGNDRRNFELRQVSSQIGVLDGRSVKEKDNALIWLSRRGIEKMAGTTIERASDPIRPLIDTIISASGNTRTKTYNTQGEWEAGSYNTSLTNQGPTSTTIYPGSVVPSTWSHSNVAGFDWNAGTLVDISSSNPNQTSGTLILDGERFNDGNYTANPIWTPLTGTWDASSGILVPNGTSDSAIFTSSTWNNGTISFDSIYTDSTAGSVATYIMLDIPGYSSKYVYVLNDTNGIRLIKVDGTVATICDTSVVPVAGESIPIIVEKSGSNWTLTAKGISCSGSYSPTFTPISFSFRRSGGSSSGGGIDNIVGSFYVSTGTWTSPIYDTTFSTPVGGPYYFSDTVPDGSTMTYVIRQSTAGDGGGWGSWTTVSTTTSGEYRIPFTKRYWQEQIQLSTSYSTQTPSVELTSLEATATGYYIGDCVNTSGVTSWGNFRPSGNITGGADVTYAISTGTSCNEVTRSTANWITQNANAPIASSTSPYLGFRFFEIPVTTTDTLRVDALTVEWNEGSERPPVSSAVYRDRFYLFYTTSTASGAINDHAVVYDMNDKWSLLDDIHAYSATVYENKLYTGDSNASGFINIQDVGLDDIVGTNAIPQPYTFRIKTNDYDFGNPIELKKLKRIYLSLKSEESAGQNIEINVKYYIDGGTTAYSLGMADLNEATEGGYFIAKFPSVNSMASTFHWLKLEIEYTGEQGPFNLYGIKVVYSPIRWE